jgi:hypothetical protein
LAPTHDEFIDLVTGWVRATLRFLMVQHPTRTSVGLTGGITVGTIIDALKPSLPGINLMALTDLRLAIAGVFLSNVSLLFKKERLPEALEQEFAAVRKAAREGKLSGPQCKMLYVKIANTAIDGAVFHSGDKDEVSQKKRISRERAR